MIEPSPPPSMPIEIARDERSMRVIEYALAFAALIVAVILGIR